MPTRWARVQYHIDAVCALLMVVAMDARVLADPVDPSASAATPPDGDAPAPPKRLGLCLCGGGATGAAYEIGVLAALEANVPGFRVGSFEVIVGTSAGSLIAALLASGVSVTRLYHSVTSGDEFFHIKRSDIYQLDLHETARKMERILRAGARVFRRMAKDREAASEAAWSDFTAALPDGLFTLHGFAHWVDRFQVRHGLPRHFDQVGPQLLVPVNNLDTGHREVFGRGYRLDASIAEAVAASCAIPLFFSPVRIHGGDYIDGGTGRVAHVDLAQRAGATHVLVVNPIVPWNLERRLRELPPDDAEIGPQRLTRIRSRGMLSIWNQSFRMANAVKLHLGLRRFKADRPDLALALIEPDERDETLFITNPMDTGSRARIARHAYDTTVQRLREGDDAVRAVCLGLPGAHRLDGLRRQRVVAGA